VTMSPMPEAKDPVRPEHAPATQELLDSEVRRLLDAAASYRAAGLAVQGRR
jgi:hypothetical protein